MNKKEIEKNRQQKKKQKEQKKEERKANSSKGKSLDQMMAYVDENGNISSTPPDPDKRVELNLEDIQFSVARKVHSEEDNFRTGIVTFFNDAKGFGFIRDINSQESIFVHINGLVDRIQENNRVSFQVEKGFKGLQAFDVKLVK